MNLRLFFAILPGWAKRFFPVYPSFLLGCAALVLTGCGGTTEVSREAQLVLSTSTLGPATTFELRFDQPIVAADRVGTTQAVSTLVFVPAVRGAFVWTSSRSGVFTPEEPLRLGTRYEVTLRPGLTDPAGRPLNARLRRLIDVPPFGVAKATPDEVSTNAVANPSIFLWFNASVKADELVSHLGFMNQRGQWIHANVEPVTGEDLPRYESTYEGWDEAFAAARAATTASRDENKPVPNLLVVTPKQPLFPGTGWKMVLSRGYHSADGRHRYGAGYEVAIGDIRPMELEAAVFSHVLNRPPALELTFNKDLPGELTNTWPQWVVVKNAPGNLDATVDENRLSIAGAWERLQTYAIEIAKGLPSVQGLALATNSHHRLEVPPIPPRLYFPAFSAAQYANGNRTLPLLAVNVESINVRAKLLEPATVIYALSGYRHYTDHWRTPENGYRRLDYDLVPGRTIFQQTLKNHGAVDTAGEIKLSWDAILGARKTGVVFLEAEKDDQNNWGKPRLGTQCLIRLTDLGIVWKRGGGELQAYVFSYATGKPVPGAGVTLYTDENQPLAEARTDASGVAKLPDPEPARWLIATLGEDSNPISLQESQLYTYAFEGARIPYDYETDSGPSRAAFFTDRDVYRPGDTVYYKLIHRELGPTGLVISAGSTGVVSCLDARSRVFFETNFALNTLGSHDGTVTLPNAARGEYTLNIAIADTQKSRRIQVADYQPAAFEVQLPFKPVHRAGESVEVPVSARYQFGAPLQRAQVKWFLRAEDTDFQPPGLELFRFASQTMVDNRDASTAAFNLSGEARLSAATNLVLKPEIPTNTSATRPRSLFLMADVTDANQQTIMRTASSLLHSSEFYLGLKQDRRLVKLGEELPVEIVAVGVDGKPWPQPVKVKLTQTRLTWETVQYRGAGNSVRYRNQAILTNVHELEVEVPAAGSVSNLQPFAVTNLIAAQPGEYIVTVTCQDGDGRKVSTGLQYDVTARTRLAWDYRNEEEVKLVPDKALYHPGETARVLIKAPFSGEALVTIERSRVLRSFAVKLEGNAPAVEVPIEPGFAPNVFVSVALIRGANDSTHEIKEPDYRLGYACLNVEDPATRLQATVAPGKTNCLPGETIEAVATVRDSAGQPVPDAEVTIFAVDEGVLSLGEWTMPDLHRMLLARSQLSVLPGASMRFVLSEDPEELRYSNKGYLGGGGGKERVRQRFLACAVWRGALRTGADGTARVEFAAPDNITKYRLVAVVHTAASQFGSTASSFTVSKPLMVEPALPQVAYVGDAFAARAVVFNETGDTRKVDVSLELDPSAEAATKGTLQRTLEIAAHSSGAVEFPILIKRTGAGAWTWRARFSGEANGFADAVRSTLQTVSPLPLVRETSLVKLEAQQTNLLARLNPQLLEGEGSIRVRVSDTRLALLGEAVRHLLTYPYGCAEQTSSSLLPWVVLQRSPDLLPLTGRTAAESLAAARAGIDRLLSMQTWQGGLSYWPRSSEPEFWVSAYAAVVLTLAREASLPVPTGDLDRLLDYLSKQLREGENNPDAQCLALYALSLAGKPEAAYQTRSFEHRAKLPAETRAFLALSASLAKRDPAMIKTLLDEPVPGTKPDEDYFGGVARAQAVRLLALASVRAGSTEAEQAFNKLLASQEEGHWGTTQGNAWALLAMTEYIRVSEPRAEPGTATLAWGDKKVTLEFGQGCRLLTETFQMTPDLSRVPLVLSKEGARTLFVQVSVEARVNTGSSAAQDSGFAVKRTFYKLDDNNVPMPATDLKVGDRVLVSVRVHVPQQASYLALESPLPGLLEPVNARLKTQQIPLPGPAVGEGGAFSLPTDFEEIRADRVLFFANHVAPGNYLVSHLARVSAAGTGNAPPARIEAMYQPARFGLSAREKIACRGLE